MKKTICLFIASLMIFLLCSCNQKNSSSNEALETKTETISPTQQVINLIDDIGNSYYSSREKIDKAKNAYNALSTDEKKLVTNHDVLIESEITYMRIKTQEEIKSMAESYLKSNLKNPSSLQINSQTVDCYYTSDIYQPILAQIEIDYSAQNGFGGYNRDKVYYAYMYDANSRNWSLFAEDDEHFVKFYMKARELGASYGSPYFDEKSNG